MGAAVCRIGAALVVVLGAAVAPARGSFVVETNPYLIGQAPDWLDDAHVVWHDPMTRDEDADGQVARLAFQRREIFRHAGPASRIDVNSLGDHARRSTPIFNLLSLGVLSRHSESFRGRGSW